MSNLYIVATPIGNLEDISFRAIRILKEVDFILCEDTRVSRKLLDHYNIRNNLISFHHHSGNKKYEKILEILRTGKSLALISDAGTPNISDPGGQLVELIRKFLPSVNIEPIPGPSALISALSVSGIKADKFLFLGFLPHKKGRLSAIKEVLGVKYPAVIYESKHRISKLLLELLELKCTKKIIVLREISKKHYSFYNESVEEMYKKFEQDKNNLKGEFTVIIY